MTKQRGSLYRCSVGGVGVWRTELTEAASSALVDRINKNETLEVETG